VQVWHFAVGPEEHHDEPQPGESVFESQFEYGNTGYETERYTPVRGLRFRQKGEKILQPAF
jgi:hypothetical protein